jgi:ADP-ribose pyrophosphatase
MHVYLATDLIETSQKLEADEILTVERYSFEDLNEMIRTGEIEDAKTILGIVLADARSRPSIL